MHTGVADPVLGSPMACLTSQASESDGMGAGWARGQAEGPPAPEGWGVGWMIRVGSEKGQKETGVLSASSHDLEWDTDPQPPDLGNGWKSDKEKVTTPLQALRLCSSEPTVPGLGVKPWVECGSSASTGCTMRC